MANGPVSGEGIALTLPPGKTVSWTVTAQGEWNQFVWLQDRAGQQVFFVASGSSPDGHPVQIGNGSFTGTSEGSYMLYVGFHEGTAWSQVLWDDFPLTFAGTTMSATFNFIAEDGADQDYNDCCVTLTWFAQSG